MLEDAEIVCSGEGFDESQPSLLRIRSISETCILFETPKIKRHDKEMNLFL